MKIPPPRRFHNNTALHFWSSRPEVRHWLYRYRFRGLRILHILSKFRFPILPEMHHIRCPNLSHSQQAANWLKTFPQPWLFCRDWLSKSFRNQHRQDWIHCQEFCIDNPSRQHYSPPIALRLSLSLHIQQGFSDCRGTYHKLRAYHHSEIPWHLPESPLFADWCSPQMPPV